MLLVSLPADTATPMGKSARLFSLSAVLLLDELELEILDEDWALKPHCEIDRQGTFP